MNTLRTHLLSLAVVGALGTSGVTFANHPAANPNWGTPVHEGSADRTIVLDANAKWVNVTGGETIRFVVAGKSFLWRFDTYSTEPAFELNKIAPAGMLGERAIRVYVAPDPLYSSG
jgi:hypothetical protein